LDGAWLRAMLEAERTLAAAEDESVSWPRTRQPLWWRRATVTSTSKRSPRSAGRNRSRSPRFACGSPSLEQRARRVAELASGGLDSLAHDLENAKLQDQFL
jgi:hypothetical protein